ncbi:arginine biosynthesis bifunctional protein argJ [Paracoccidioides lutzii Pb01]|uniref:Arginine biosynthesis bifunctional protein ArgJ, mitochondrial n=1 Tax=Paracoccidioides lutzii (strain ATCC MYA-826 / Pb01) TaxID=502779 RepID=ARGJ_PARBA|nr:arginine biosynthesis bifunctional protein argJ [Paracoccidioides lutzii Pb01]C1H986.1 RecName: Full=Arginine biosynthesis bifunctional protein ArgJ, mitochondrial; Includes: RecName: Full=Glutamate N-acetyltransferase; Short=GAT; AltName: Full=Ornithine acetyltransferase; Short=OATase; AltName: Full=Ornithine transacetylase; Includes: RecName: Full=Amino-acid acetyltransferase; AltName: Full=N-acetylglutamate synthase; Short=AGS; Contains: RecName: Full=Arginine biosynthesis bifunctional prote
MKTQQSFHVVAGFVCFPMSKTSQSRCYSTLRDFLIPPSKQKFVPSSGTYPKGFLAAGAHAGVKESNTQFRDVALICSKTPCSAAAVFTTNKFQAAPVQVSKQVLEAREGADITGVVINSGCANAVTGKGGLEDAKSMSAKVDECNGTPSTSSKGPSTLVMSTGVIGRRLPIKRILNAIPVAHSNLSSTHKAWLNAARSICTTDTFPKLLSRTFTLPSSPNHTYRIAGMTKGAGMIHPNMATLLGILCTDVPISPAALKPLLSHAVSRSFNCISIDGDTSTNDTVALLANGAAGGQTITTPSSPNYAAMQTVLTSFAQSLAQLVVRDGEGATKFVTVRVLNSPSQADARAIASTIARSPLVKTALYGRDANWGRILCAIGYTQGIQVGTVVPERTSVSFKPVDGSEELKLLVNGEPQMVNEERAARILQDEDLEIVVDLGGGEKGGEGMAGEEGIYWFCDFSHEYVTINADYRT